MELKKKVNVFKLIYDKFLIELDQLRALQYLDIAIRHDNFLDRNFFTKAAALLVELT